MSTRVKVFVTCDLMRLIMEEGHVTVSGNHLLYDLSNYSWLSIDVLKLSMASTLNRKFSN